ncbi:VOC family protein [Maricurvus nonylphenolicus]|uniref:VOC family protein n=1 Tax=Maricurvus nonylphenolicus TaxID=1008307 RepID=UPI0036F1ADBA
MIGYITIGVNDLEAAGTFYDALLAEIGAVRLFEMETMKYYGTGVEQSTMLAICTPYDKQAQHPGNGNMIAIPGGTREGVDKLYAKALELGGTDEGEPGVRSFEEENMPVFYGAYVRDLDGNKLCFFEMS